MGYTTDFTGSIAISPPLNAEEIAYLHKFNETRRMDRKNGPYFVDGTGDYGQGRDPDIRDYNKAPAGQPGLWFIAGSFAQCRIYSKYLALQIKAADTDVITGSKATGTMIDETHVFAKRSKV